MEREQVIVSLTSFPPAITYAVGAIQSILRGSVLPDKVVLYLTFSEFEQAGVPIPAELTSLAKTNPRFEIRNYDKNIRSYRKLVPALTDFPDAVIVTIDDDVDYHSNMLKSLLNLHRRYPHAVLAHRAKRILPSKPYKKWPKFHWYAFLLTRIHQGFDIIQTGCGGVLYPPHSLCTEMMDPELFTSLAPTMDDIWFWAAATANSRPVIPVPFGKNKPKGLGKPKELALKTSNFKAGTDRNSAALQAILNRYPIIRQRLENGK